ncbi:Tigger transposable element-derived protein 6 [Gamsiella multidivaricata]|nr:Tigger transposable element-derived protein 6 [Gamsiella multidivaricata]
MARASHTLEQQVELLDIFHYLDDRKEDLPIKLSHRSFGRMVGVNLLEGSLGRMLEREDKLRAAARTYPTGAHYIVDYKNLMIEEVLYRWLQDQRKQNVPVNGKMIKKACTGLVDLQDEAGSVDLEAIEPKLTDVRQLCAQYTPDNIFNCDEIGFYLQELDGKFYTTLGSKSGAKANRCCRVSTLFCINASGSSLAMVDAKGLLKPLVIGDAIPKDLEKDLGVCDDDHLRNILKVSKSNFRGKLTISLESPSRNFSAWTFNDVCAEYNLPESTDPSLSVIPQFAEIEAAILDSDLHKEALDQLIKEVDFRTHALQLTGANDATKSIIMASFLVAATRLFEEDLFLGRRGNGPVDFSVHSRKTMDYSLGVTEVKKEDLRQGMVQNIVQLEATLTAKKRKREKYEMEGEEGPPCKLRSYGIVTDTQKWFFLECTLDDEEEVSYGMAQIPEEANYRLEWRGSVQVIFQKLVWLFSRMRDELPVRDSYARKMTSSPSNKRMILDV